MDVGFNVSVVKNVEPDCLVVCFHGCPQSFDQIKQLPGHIGKDNKRHNLILDFSRLDIPVEYLRYFFEQLKVAIEAHALDWCSVSPPQAQNYIPKGLHYIMKNEKPVFSNLNEAKCWIDGTVR